MDPYRHVRFYPRAQGGTGYARPPASPVRHPPPRHRCDVRAEGEALDAPSAEFVQWVLAQAGVDYGMYRQGPLVRRLAAFLRHLRAPDVAAARARLQREPGLIAQAANALLIGVTDFFREPEVFRNLDANVLPRLAAEGAEIRAWSVGCSDGAELYSVAMLLARRGLLDRCRLLGTDCRADAVAQARQGWFEAARLQRVGPEMQREFFAADRGGGRIAERLRQAARWERGDALDPAAAPAGPWDLILCCNVTIYLEHAAAETLWDRLIAALRPGGYLVVGKSERPEPRGALLRTAPCTYRKG